jgi:putative glutamine amidotransferase
VLSGGGDVDPARYGQRAVPEVYGVDQERDEWEIALACAALDRAMPVLAICRGAQVLNVACGGTLVQDLASVTPTSHRDAERSRELVHHVAVEPDSRLHHVLQVDAIGVNTLHHQAVDDVGHGLRVVARDDEGTIEAIETIDDRPVLGVQWHPELLFAHAVHRQLFLWIADVGASNAC